MSRFQVVKECEYFSLTNNFIYKIQKGVLIPEDERREKIRIAYWKHRGQRGFGQFAPILPEAEFAALVRTAISEGVLTQEFAREVSRFRGDRD